MTRLTSLFYKLARKTPDVESRLFADAYVKIMLTRYTEDELEYAIRWFFAHQPNRGFYSIAYLQDGVVDAALAQRKAAEVRESQTKICVSHNADANRNRHLYERGTS